jgi:hypothetical protein
MWLRGELLWAADEGHLTFLKHYVAAGIRETSSSNSSLASELPAWIKSAKHRAALVRRLRHLRELV